jgi:uncharacterized protein (DUF305 family)
MMIFRRIGVPAVAGAALIVFLSGCSGSGEKPADAQATASPASSGESASPTPSDGTPSPSVSASASASGTPGQSPTPTASPVETPAAGFNAADVSFAQLMIPHNLQSLDMAALVAGRAKDIWITDLAAKLQEAQDPEIRTFKGWLNGWGKQPKPRGYKMPGMLSDAEMAKLAKAKGAAFDRLFVTMMIEHYEGAIKMAEDEQAKGVFAEAKAVAAAMATSRQAEVKEMKKYLAKLK